MPFSFSFDFIYASQLWSKTDQYCTKNGHSNLIACRKFFFWAKHFFGPFLGAFFEELSTFLASIWHLAMLGTILRGQKNLELMEKAPHNGRKSVLLAQKNYLLHFQNQRCIKTVPIPVQYSLLIYVICTCSLHRYFTYWIHGFIRAGRIAI